MSLVNPHSITKDFEKILSEYTGAPYVICVDSLSNALFLGLGSIGQRHLRNLHYIDKKIKFFAINFL